MTDRENVIKESEEAIDLLAKAEEPTFWMDFVRCAFENALALLKEHEYARCMNCQFRDFGENEVDSWDSCKLHRHNTSPDEFCSWFVQKG